jgi:thiol-disulfide isomerase/thioredoxin
MKHSRRLMTLLILVMWTAGALAAQESDGEIGWQSTLLRDVTTGEEFRISDFAGKPVLIESFAVWCPTCTRQQQEIRALHEAVGNSVISISLDVDPNEDEAMVRAHAAENGFTWRYAVSPPELTRSLMAEFGTAIVVAPSAPVILICPDGVSAELLRRGVKRAGWLRETIEDRCGLSL